MALRSARHRLRRARPNFPGRGGCRHAPADDRDRLLRPQRRRHYTEIYKTLGVTLNDADERGESFYKDRLSPLVERLKKTLEFGGEGAAAALRGSKRPPQEWEFSAGNLPAMDAAEAKGA